ncbi:DNA-directed RNA polymerase subunit beta [Helianthus annuus]|nr:DNA-directed RNA polymerase subunit beta [Helianthus annuus]
MSTIPGFNQIQFEGFCRFIDQGLAEELSKFPKIEDTNQEIDFEFFLERYQLVEPLIKERDAVYESLTYSSELYVSARLIWKNDRRRYIQEQTILIGKIPIMTSLGAFIVNGIYRIVINQILQSPGIYYQSELNDNGISVYTGTIISDWGGRLELEIDRKARIWVRVSRQQKLSILVLLSAMGLNIREILENVCYPELFLSFLNDKKKIGSKENAILEFYQQFACVEGDPVFSESLSKDLQKKFFQQRCELGGIGRRNMNRRLNLDIPQNNTFLLPRDILAAADRLIRIKFGMGTLDDMNHLQNKRIRSVADLLQEQFGLALVRLENMARGNIYAALKHNWTPTPQNLVNSTPLTDTYKVFFRLHPLSQVLDRTNPLTQIVHGRKLSYLGPGGLTARTATFPIRDIHPSHYGRICPIDTSEGINVGLIGSLAIHARIGRWGSLESPFYQISERSKGAQMLYLSPGRDEYYMVAAGNSLALNQGIQKREIKVGDKVAGRHGNKGIISKILPRQDMPYLQDGRPVDMVFNPLGVPSRMNVGQIFESSLGLAGDLLDRHYRIAPFDERYEQEASRKLVFSELYEASKQTANPWIFEPESPGKSRIFDGRTGDPFEQPVIIGKPYILKLIHQVDDKIHGRSSGRYSRLTQQPLKGRAKKGGQRVGEMEVWALEGFGVAYILQEMLTYKSDHIRARQEVLGTIIFGGRIPTPEDAPESFRLFVRELRSLALELNHFLVSEKTFQLNRKEA